MKLGSSQENKEKAVEVGGALAKTVVVALGTIAGGPVAGIMAAATAELFTVVIPNLRHQRYEKFVDELKAEAGNVEPDRVATVTGRIYSPEFVDLFEDGARQAVRALSDERIQRIAKLLINGLTSDDFTHANYKRILELLGQIDDVELIVLQSHTAVNSASKVFREIHHAIFQHADKPTYEEKFMKYGGPFFLTTAIDDEELTEEQRKIRYQDRAVYEEARENHAIFQSRIDHLISLGLLGDTYNSNLALTPLGKVLLREIDLVSAKEEAPGTAVNAITARNSATTTHSAPVEKHPSAAELERFGQEIAKGVKRELGL